MTAQKMNLLSFSGKIKILHMTWFAFFLSFVVWFNHAPLMLLIKESLGLTQSEVKTILILNVALTIPARIAIGMLVDKFGPKRTYSTLLVLERFLIVFAGPGFVIGTVEMI